MKFCPFVLQILSGNEILASIKGQNSVTNLMTGNNPNLDLVNMKACIKFGETLSICSQDFVRKRNSGINQLPKHVTNVRKIILDLININAYIKLVWFPPLDLPIKVELRR